MGSSGLREGGSECERPCSISTSSPHIVADFLLHILHILQSPAISLTTKIGSDIAPPRLNVSGGWTGLKIGFGGL